MYFLEDIVELLDERFDEPTDTAMKTTSGSNIPVSSLLNEDYFTTYSVIRTD